MRIEEIIVVEGRDDTEAVKRAAECETIETHGFGIRESTWKSLKRAYEARGLIILTDPDHAGDTIRRKIKERFPEAREAFLPRARADRGGDIGVENAKPEDIREALMKARPAGKAAGKEEDSLREGPGGASCGAPGGAAPGDHAQEVTWKMMTDAGLTGSAGSRKRREDLAEILGISYGNARSMFSHISAFGITTGEFNEAVRAIDDKADKE